MLRRGYEKSAHLYDIFDTKDNIGFFAHYGSDAGEILDIGAGTGRIAIPIAERGVRVHCIEPSPAMRREFEKKLGQDSKAREKITLIEGEAASFDLKRTFPAAFLSGTFDHLTDDGERLSALRNIHRHLKPGGKLVFDLFLGLMKEEKPQPAGEVALGDTEYRRFVRTTSLSNRTMEVILVFEKRKKGTLLERIEERSLVGRIDRGEIHDLLRQSGFEVRWEFGDYDFRPYRQGDPLLIIEATKSL